MASEQIPATLSSLAKPVCTPESFWHRAQQTLLATVLPISLFTTLEKPWLYCTKSPDFIYVCDFNQTPKFSCSAEWALKARTKEPTHTHTQLQTHKLSAHKAHTHSVEGSISAGHGPSHPFWFKVCLFSSPESPINDPWLSEGTPPLSSLHFHFPHFSVSGSPEAGAAAGLPTHTDARAHKRI